VRVGLPVPRAFCVLSAAYREHLESNGLIANVTSTIAELQSTPPEKRPSLLSALREAITQAPMAPALAAEVGQHYDELGAQSTAVRSSATAEDLPGHSFAGQYETYLGVADLAGCLKAIRQCWASLWTDRAFEYRERNGFRHLDVDMAVIVQALARKNHILGIREAVPGIK